METREAQEPADIDVEPHSTYILRYWFERNWRGDLLFGFLIIVCCICIFIYL